MRSMLRVHATPLPDDALLQVHRAAGAFTDCYVVNVDGEITFDAYVTAFYTTPLFKVERLILRWALSRPSTDEQARQLADGGLDRFAAWDVEQRGPNQLMLSDLHGKTRSWLMVEPLPPGERGTRLYFGSAVTALRKRRDGTTGMPFLFRALLRFHSLYSIALLSAAARRLQASSR